MLEDQLRPHGLTMRHYPQSFEFSTLGGWIATRSGGHFATNRTHIDDFVESIRTVTPRGVMESRRLPGSGAGPSPDRLVIGSEGTLGVITEAWMRLQDRPVHKATASVRFATMAAGVAACRALAQSGLEPTNCRLLDPGEAAANAGGAGEAILVLGFESADHPVDADIDEALDRLRRPPRGRGRHRQPFQRPRRWQRAGRRGRGVALVVPARPLPARRDGGPRLHRRDVRDRRDLGPLRGAAPRGRRRHRGARWPRCAAAAP